MKIKTFIVLAISALLFVLALNTVVGLRTSSQLGGLLEYISGPAWNAADGAMEGQIGLQAQIIILQQIYYGESTLAESREAYAIKASMASILQQAEKNRDAGAEICASRSHLEAEIHRLDGLLRSFRT